MLKKSRYITLVVVLLLTLALLNLPKRTSSQLKLAVSGLFLPLDGVARSAGRALDGGAQTVVTRDELQREVELLRREKQQWQIQGIQGEEIARENARLRHHLGLVPRLPWKWQLAQVVGRDPANWWFAIRIDKGLRDGLTPNCPVFTPDGLVGRVSESSYAQSQVVLVGDPNCRVSAMIEETRETGVISPNTPNPMDNMLVDLGNLSRTGTLKSGQRVVTSGLGGIFPKGLLIGHIVDYRSVGFGLSYEARVKVAVRLNALEEVFVKLPEEARPMP